MSKLVARRTLFTALLALGLSGVASAAPPTQGLGQAWPNATDVSLNPHYHAYSFISQGITYVQINDAAGNLIGAVGTASGQFIVLPIGNSQSVTIPQQLAVATQATPTASPSAVYNDGSTVITATPMSDGTTTLQAATLSPQTATTSTQSASQICNPITCSTHGS